MYFEWTLLKLHIKRYASLIPGILLETLLFLLVVLGIGVFAAKVLYQDKAIGEIKVGVVAQEDEKTELLLTFVESMDSMKGTVSFTLLTQEEAGAQLKSGEIYAAVIMPEGLVEGILSGQNIPARILIGNSRGKAETEVFIQLSSAGANLLTTAQAGIYAANQLCREMESADRISQSEDYLNQAYLKYALGRSSLLKEREVDALAGSSLADYYGISLFLAFLTFTGISFGRIMGVVPTEREYILQTRGVGAAKQYLIETAAFSGVFSMLGSLLGIPMALWLSGKSGSAYCFSFWWLLLAVVCVSAGVFLRMLFQVIGNSAAGMVAVFVLLLVCMTISGIFIPSAFLPIWAEQVGKYLPYQIWMEELILILKGRPKGNLVLQIVVMVAVFSGIGTAAAVCRQRLGRLNQKKGAV